MYSLLSDSEIKQLCRGKVPMIEPFVDKQEGKPSYGLGSSGYDLRLGKAFLVQEGPALSMVLDPLDKRIEEHWRKVVAEDSFVLAPGQVALAETVEWLNMPDDVMGVVLGKSTYARLGLLVNATPAEPGWHGRLTLELKNLNQHKGIRLYVGQGIAQILFSRTLLPNRTYVEKESGGLYQNQQGVTLPR
jgi:dCTP deaminase